VLGPPQQSDWVYRDVGGISGCSCLKFAARTAPHSSLQMFPVVQHYHGELVALQASVQGEEDTPLSTIKVCILSNRH
jgi:hypothetical protein